MQSHPQPPLQTVPPMKPAHLQAQQQQQQQQQQNPQGVRFSPLPPLHHSASVPALLGGKTNQNGTIPTPIPIPVPTIPSSVSKPSLPPSYHYPPPVNVTDTDPSSSLMSPLSAPILDPNSFPTTMHPPSVTTNNGYSTNYYSNSPSYVASSAPGGSSDGSFPAASPSSSSTPSYYQPPLPTTAHAAQSSPRAFFSTDEGPLPYSKTSANYSTSQSQSQPPQMVQTMPSTPSSSFHAAPYSQQNTSHPHFPPPALSVNNDIQPSIAPQNSPSLYTSLSSPTTTSPQPLYSPANVNYRSGSGPFSPPSSSQHYPQTPTMPSVPSNSYPSSFPTYQPTPESIQNPYSHVIPVHPAFVSLTSSSFPNSSSLWNTCAIPLAVTMPVLGPNISLFKDVPEDPSVPTPPLISLTQAGVIRCKECKAYINAYAQFHDGGKSWFCNICNVENAIPPAYFSPLDPSGRRVDLMNRPELYNGSYEILAPKDYTIRPSVPPLFVLCIDVSTASQSQGVLAAACNAAIKLVDVLAQHPRALLSIVTFSDTVHYYTIDNQSPVARMHVVTQVSDPSFLPSPLGLLVKVKEYAAKLKDLFQRLPAIHKITTDASCALFALECSTMVMGRYGGRLVGFLSCLNTLGRGALTDRLKRVREGSKQLTEEGMATILLQAEKTTGSENSYTKMAEILQKHFITCDLFFFPYSSSSYLDVATWSQLSHLTGGSCYFYPRFSAADHERLYSDLHTLFTMGQSFECVFRCRSNKGISVRKFHGNFLIRSQDLLSIPVADAYKTIGIELELNDKDKQKADKASRTSASVDTIILQAALLYTSYKGERRILVHTLRIPLISSISTVYSGANATAIAMIWAKQAVEVARTKSIVTAREELKAKMVAVARALPSKHVDTSSPSIAALRNQLPLFVMGILKHPAFAEISYNQVSSDARSFFLSVLISGSDKLVLTMLRPRMMPLHDLFEQTHLGSVDEYGIIQYPTEASLSISTLVSHQIWLVHTGQHAFIRIGSQVPEHYVHALVGSPAANDPSYDPHAELHLLPSDSAAPSSFISRVHALLSSLASSSLPYAPQTLIIREGYPNERQLMDYLFDDRKGHELSWNEYYSTFYEY